MTKENLNNCSISTTDSIIVLRENKSIFRGLNTKRKNISKYKIDGCVYKNSADIRCDYLLETTEKIFFVELKGINVKKGLNQLLCSINNLTRFFEQKSINARLITTRGAKPNRLNTYKEYKNLSKLIGTNNIILRNTPFEENIN